jgi:hypothetical protein
MPHDGKLLFALDRMERDARAGGRRLDRAELFLRRARSPRPDRPRLVIIAGGMMDDPDPDETPYSVGRWWDEDTELTRPIAPVREDYWRPV